MYVTHQIKACPKKKEEWYQPLFFKLKKGKKCQTIKVLEKIEMLLLLYYNSNPTNQPNRRFIK